MSHPAYPEELKVGCVCAGKMEQDRTAAERREADLKNAGQRRRRWLTRKWRVSDRGNQFLNTDGFNIVVFAKGSGYGGRLQDRRTDQSVFLRA